MELQQSKMYQSYIASLGWTVFSVGKSVLFLKHIPFLGTLAKLQRPDTLPEINSFIALLKEKKIKTLAIEPSPRVNQKEFSSFCTSIRPYVKLNSSPFLPTKTILIDLKPPVDTIFNHFSEAKRRAVRKAEKNGVLVRESPNISDLIHIKNKSAGFLGFITTHGTRELWNVFSPKNATTLIAYSSEKSSDPIAGVLLVFYNNTSYYWIAGAKREGKKLFAPTLLVYEALKISKKRNMKTFDFVGVFDDRMPNENRAWKGFTKFKEGFGGKELYYPVSSLSSYCHASQMSLNSQKSQCFPGVGAKELV
ncbi:MAG: peptidoglycan bridge formation glycyltransferase FemA/FemB family protein [Patescibacteria group bacterium]